MSKTTINPNPSINSSISSNNVIVNNNVESVDLSSNVRDMSIVKQENAKIENEMRNKQKLIDKGENVINYANNFVGTSYISGGNDLTKGVDCSGFTKLVYEEFGISLPRTSYEQRQSGVQISSINEAIPGDLLCFKGHVGIYMGDNKMIHASSGSGQVRIQDNLDLYFNETPLITIRRLID